MEPVHLQVLDAARAVAAPDWTFAPADIIAALPHLNPATVRTHVASRCCSDAPANHHTRYRYFKAVQRARYRIEPAFRQRRRPAIPSQERILASMDAGIDLTLVRDSLAMTPTGRLETMRRSAASLDAMRRS